jgi:hypothetical protein
LGGFGLPDLTFLGFTLRLRWEWLQRTQLDEPWVRLPSKPQLVVDSMLQASVSVRLGDGATAKFWTDAWLPDGAVCRIAPNLFRAVRRGGRGRSVRDALANHQWATDISDGPTAVVITEYLRLWLKVESIQLQPGVQDRFVWKWSVGGDYSSSSAYRAFFLGRTTMLGAKDIWRASTPPKVKFFFWLALHGWLWTAERRMRHGLQQHADCALCN